jgi:hypothetical protein
MNASTKAAHGMMTNHSMSVFLEIVNATIHDAVNLGKTAKRTSGDGGGLPKRFSRGLRIA